MLFSSHLFIFGFLPLAIVAFFFVGRMATSQLALCAMILASLLFYYFNGLAQLPVLVLSVLVNHTFVVLSLRTKKESRKTLIIGTAIALNLSLLAYYKYFTFIEQQVEALQVVQWMHPRWSLELIAQYYQMYPWGKLGIMIAMPLGISF